MIGALDRLRMRRTHWRDLKLAHQFAIAGGAFTLGAMAFCGFVISNFVAESVIQQRAAATALFMDGVVSPLMRGLIEDGALSPLEVRRLDTLMNSPEFHARFPYLEVWLPDGTIAYSNSKSIVARRFALPPAATEAFTGRVVASFSDLSAPEHIVRNISSRYVEIYLPVRQAPGDEIIAVAEVYENADPLERVLLNVKIISWATVGVTALVVMAGLFGIVLEGSRTIERQKRALSRRLQQSHALNARYRNMKEQAQAASRNVTELTDQYLRTIGADLHDGPAQMIGFATLKIEQARRSDTPEARNAALSAVETSLTNALDDIRDISRGLVLPDIERLTLDEVIEHAVALHTRRTGVEVQLDNSVGAVRAAFAVSICVFRFVQEGLNNAFRHGLEEDQRVTAALTDGVLTLSVTNLNPVGDRKGSTAAQPGIGLQGLRARVQSIGGTIKFARQDVESRLEMSLDLQERALHD